jgi:hypothetical protein
MKHSINSNSRKRNRTEEVIVLTEIDLEGIEEGKSVMKNIHLIGIVFYFDHLKITCIT